jgi:hypothetical protein
MLLSRNVKKHRKEPKLEEKRVAENFLVSHTKEQDSSHRLITTQSIPELHVDYLVSCKCNAISLPTFTEVYHHMRVLRNKHAKYTIYHCPKCSDHLPLARKLVDTIDPNDQPDDFAEATRVLNKLMLHRDNALRQSAVFDRLWDDPPPSSVVVAEDAGKRFVLDGKGVAHVMMLKYRDLLGNVHEKHYFFCISDSAVPKVTRYSIATSWLTLHEKKAFPEYLKKVYVFHDGGRNEYNNSSGLLLYACLQKMLNLEFVVSIFVSYHGKGVWDGLLGAGMLTSLDLCFY